MQPENKQPSKPLFNNRFQFATRKKVYIIPLKETDLGYEQVKKPFRVNPLKDLVVWKGKEFSYSLKEICRVWKNNAYIYKDIDNGKTVLKWGTIGEAIAPDGIKQRNKERLMDKAMQVNPHDYGLLTIILAGVAFFAIGAVVMILAYPSIFPGMMAQAQNATMVVR